ncbi:MAG: UDP-N-acetylglucosamine 1-carboxyvinyltransferase [Phycisphaerales bacterium]|jgi:UDP-N-acetylglucosamine 1-carboxyvinyltransferase
MDYFRIQGGRRLSGRVTVEGAKNAALPLMAASLLTTGRMRLTNVGPLADIRNLGSLLERLGVHVHFGDDDTITLHTSDESQTHAPYEIVKTMRASICVLGPMLARRKRAVVSMPGGCAFGTRPIDLHLKGLAKLGAKIEFDGGNIVASCDRLRGATVFLGGANGPTVLGTANVMSAATLAEGRTVIESAACEPEIVDLASMLNRMGARIRGAGSPRIVIDGVDALGGCEHRVMPDRIVAGTYAIAAAMTNGDVILDDFPYDSLLAAINHLEEVGVHVAKLNANDEDSRCSVRVSSNRVLRPTIITTQPHPGFPTDLQAQFMALLSIAEGNSIVTEKIYTERFLHVAELSRMGAQVYRQGSTAVISGVRQLHGAQVMASDLRASACLVLAGLAAQGETVISRVYHLDRGYSSMERVLQSLGADIERCRESKAEPAEDTVPAILPSIRGAGLTARAAQGAVTNEPRQE